MKHLMIDCETFGQDSTNCAVIDISANIFDWDRFTHSKPYSFEELLKSTVKYKLNVKEQVTDHNYEIEKSSLNWWNTQEERIKISTKPLKSDLSIEEFTEAFLEQVASVEKISFWWSRSNIFDPIILMRIFDSGNSLQTLKAYLPPWKVRDVKTFIDSKLDFPKVNKFIPVTDTEYWSKIFVEHDSVHDVASDIMRMQSIVRAENDLEQVAR
jgi:hypothetical protein